MQQLTLNETDAAMGAAWSLPVAEALGFTNKLRLVPQRGCEIYDWLIGSNCTIPVEYEYTEPEAACTDPSSPRFGPAVPGGVTVLNLFVNGYWVDAEDVLGREMCGLLEASILKARAQ